MEPSENLNGVKIQWKRQSTTVDQECRKPNDTTKQNHLENPQRIYKGDFTRSNNGPWKCEERTQSSSQYKTIEFHRIDGSIYDTTVIHERSRKRLQMV